MPIKAKLTTNTTNLEFASAAGGIVSMASGPPLILPMREWLAAVRLGLGGWEAEPLLPAWISQELSQPHVWEWKPCPRECFVWGSPWVTQFRPCLYQRQDAFPKINSMQLTDAKTRCLCWADRMGSNGCRSHWSWKVPNDEWNIWHFSWTF